MRRATVLLLGLSGASFLQASTFAQVAIQGKVQIAGYGAGGGVQINYRYTQNVQIMAYNPPAYSGSMTSDYYYFTNDVMNQPYVDGVTLELDWANIEEPLPTTPCTPINSDTCQLDAVGVYHAYNWTSGTNAYDQFAVLPTYPLGILQWFGPFNGVQTYKKVNFILAGINSSGGVNTATPSYVTSLGSPTYASNFSPPYNRQDVMNTVLDCSNMPWTGINPNAGATYSIDSTISSKTALVTWTGCCSSSSSTSFHTGDTVWVTSSIATNYQTPQPTSTTPGGATITVVDANDFYYTGIGTLPGGGCSTCTFITTSQSTPVPYELPYVTAWEAFMAAVNLHYNPGYTVSGIGVVGSGTGGTNQLGYVRSGTWVGGESFPECITNPGGGTNGPQNGLTGLASPYAFVATPPSSNTWLLDYQNKVSYIESLNPTMQRLWPIDDGVPTDSMAPIAIAVGNGVGNINGFGSQGLSLLDMSCTPSAADWCNEFQTYYARGMPLELQQIAISNPDVSSCSGTGSACGTPPKVSGDMRVWLPFAVQNHATIIEIYYQDLGLAFDPSYCNNGGSKCYTLPPVSGYTAPAYTWYCEVGYGAQHNYNGCMSGCAIGGCYSQTVIAEHGLQP